MPVPKVPDAGETLAQHYPDRLTRDQAKAFLTSMGYPIATKTLAQMAAANPDTPEARPTASLTGA
jgi:hypothetical protein